VRLAFVDITESDYDAETPLTAPVGGTQSAAAYLATELARRGIEITFINRVRQSHTSNGIRFVNAETFEIGGLNEFDAVIALSAPIGASLRKEFGVTRPLILWAHVGPSDTQLADLKSEEERRAWDAFVMVSQWQADACCAHFGLPRDRVTVKRNAVSPAFLESEVAPPWFLRGAPPTLAYTIAPYRGLTVLTTTFPTIRKAIPDVTLEVFSSMKAYPSVMKIDHHEVLYELCRSLPGVAYRGAVSQRELARELSAAAALTYPSIVPETSSISLMEAMASGAMVLATDYGALAETAHGFGRLLPMTGNFFELATRYAAMVIEALHEARANPQATAERLGQQVAFARSNYTWSKRADEWLEWLPQVIGK
jgi:glycosyltransferase involved in cell wall biosynthesis